MEQQQVITRTSGSETEGFDIREILNLLVKWWWRIALLMITFAVAAYFFTMYTYVPTYTAVATLIVNNKQIKIVGEQVVSTNDIYTSQKLVNTYSIILKSNRMMELVVEDLGLDVPPSSIRGMISVSTMKDTEVMNIAVWNTDPELAAKIANSIMKVAPEIISETVEVGSVKAVDYAKIPKYAQPPQTQRNAAVGGMLGIMIGVGLAFLFMFFDNTIKNEDDVSEKLGITFLGGIPYVKPRVSAGKIVTPFIVTEWGDHGFIESYKALRANIQFMCAVHNIKKIMVTSALNREGKSTVAINLAMALAQSGKSVLLMSCDLRKPSINNKLGMKIEGGKGLTSILAGEYSIEQCIFTNAKTGINVLPCGNIAPNPSELLSSEKMGLLLETLEKIYDFIIIDTPPVHLVSDAIALSKFVDGVILVVKQKSSTADIINSVNKNLLAVDAQILGCVLNSIKYKDAGGRFKYQYYDRYYKNYYRGYSLLTDKGNLDHESEKSRREQHSLKTRFSEALRQMVLKTTSGWAFTLVTIIGIGLVGVALWGYLTPLYNTSLLFIQPKNAAIYSAPNISSGQGSSASMGSGASSGTGSEASSGASGGTGSGISSEANKVYPAYGDQYATVLVPSVGINRPVYFGDSRDQLMKGVGHYSGSYFPGENGTIVYAGHNDVVFKDLKNVKTGDEVLVQTTDYGSFRYKVYDVQIINSKDTMHIDPVKGKEVLVLYTCYPFSSVNIGMKTERYVVFAELMVGN